MANHFITLAELEYDKANYFRKELQLANILAFIDFSGVETVSIERKTVRLQVQGKLVAQAIQTLFKIRKELNIDSLEELGEKHIIKSATILVPIDLSERSEIVGKYAIGIAETIGAGVKFHHVYFSSEGVSSSAAYEEFQETVHYEEELKAKEKLRYFTEIIYNYAKSLNFPLGEIHFGLSGGEVIDQIRNVTYTSNPSLVLLGPKDETAEDYDPGVVRKVIHYINCPVLSLPLREETAENPLRKIIYISETEGKVNEHLSIIKDLFGSDLDVAILASDDDIPVNDEMKTSINPEIIIKSNIEGNLIDFLLKLNTSLVVVDKPKTGAINILFNKDLSDKMMKQIFIPVLFLD